MAKDKERATAKQLYMKGDTQKRISELVGVQEKTISNWVAKYGWQQQRDAKLNGQKSQVNNLKQLIGTLTNERLELQTEIEEAQQEKDRELEAELRKKANQLANEIGMYNKTLENLEDKNRVPLVTYITIMESIFKDMNRSNPKLYTQSLDFQETHITKISQQY